MLLPWPLPDAMKYAAGLPSLHTACGSARAGPSARVAGRQMPRRVRRALITGAAFAVTEGVGLRRAPRGQRRPASSCTTCWCLVYRRTSRQRSAHLRPRDRTLRLGATLAAAGCGVRCCSARTVARQRGGEGLARHRQAVGRGGDAGARRKARAEQRPCGAEHAARRTARRHGGASRRWRRCATSAEAAEQRRLRSWLLRLHAGNHPWRRTAGVAARVSEHWAGSPGTCNVPRSGRRWQAGPPRARNHQEPRTPRLTFRLELAF